MTTGSPTAVRDDDPDTPPRVPTPTVGVAVIGLGDEAALAGLLEGLLPASREYQVEVALVLRGNAPAGLEEGPLLRVVAVPPDATEERMRQEGLAALDTDLVVLTTDVDPLATDWATALPRLAQVVVSHEPEVSAADWHGTLRRLAVADPGA